MYIRTHTKEVLKKEPLKQTLNSKASTTAECLLDSLLFLGPAHSFSTCILITKTLIIATTITNKCDYDGSHNINSSSSASNTCNKNNSVVDLQSVTVSE